MSVESTSQPMTHAKRPRRVWVRVLKWLAFAVVLTLVLAATGLGYFIWHAKQELATEIAKVRARGAPLTTVELNQQYQPVRGKTDITAELEAVFVLADDAELQSLAAELPVVGHGEQPPAPGSEWPELLDVESFLLRNQRMLDCFESLPQRDTTVRYPCDLTLGFGAKLPQIDGIFYGARLLSLQFRVDLHHGRGPQAVERILQQLTLANSLRHEPFVISQMVRFIIISMAIQNLERLLDHTELPDKDLIRVQATLQQLDMRASLGRAIESERAVLFTGTTWPLDALANDDFGMTVPEIERRAKAGPLRPWDATLLLQFFNRLNIACDDSIFHAQQEAAVIETEIKAILMSRRKHLYAYTLVMMPASLFSLSTFAKADARGRSADCGLAAIRYHRANQKWPDNLDQLVPEFLLAVPIDAYSGKALLFVASEREFKVYSVGDNRVDDGGTWIDGDFADEGF